MELQQHLSCSALLWLTDNPTPMPVSSRRTHPHLVAALHTLSVYARYSDRHTSVYLKPIWPRFIQLVRLSFRVKWICIDPVVPRIEVNGVELHRLRRTWDKLGT